MSSPAARTEPSTLPGGADAWRLSGNDTWPVLKTYDGRKLDRLAMPLGGIGTGTVSLGGRGDLRDWEIVNRPAKGFNPKQAFFAIRAASGHDEPAVRCLEGPLLTPFEGAHGAPTPHAGLPRFERARFLAAYPLAQVLLADDDLPFSVRLEAFNPLIPADPDHSGLPVAALRFVVHNYGAEPLDVSIAGALENFIGRDGHGGESLKNVNERRETNSLAGVFMRSDGVPADAEQWGTMALAAVADNGEHVTTRQGWAQVSWGDALLDFWDDFADDGALDDRDPGDDTSPIASVCQATRVAAGQSRAFTFLLTWHFPNRPSWFPDREGARRVGNFYTTKHTDAWHAATEIAGTLPELERDTVEFVSAFCTSALPESVKEAALFNVSTLRTQTCFRIEDGTFFGWEGCHDASGCCHGSCTHVWNYEQATPFLFGSLARSMRDVEFLHATRDDGLMSFRADLPLEDAAKWGIAAADGQMGCIMKLYRDWQLGGHDAWLRSLWPRAKRALEFAWIPGGWDADQDGVMEGCQHNTMDVEYYGPNPEVGFWYLGALRAGEEMARYLGDDDFADRCRKLFQSGSAWIDEHLFNGDYYEHEIRPIPDELAIAPGLRGTSGASNLADPELQIGAGCLTDQLVGQYAALVCGLGHLADRDHLQTTLHSIVRYNFMKGLNAHFNHMRTYALGREAGLVVCTYPKGRRPARPLPYFNEVWTGLEYTAASHMLYEGMRADGERLIETVRGRYDGERRNPFDEAECGHHYARAMASWAAVLALTGFHYSAGDGAMTFAALPNGGHAFWSSGDAWGTISHTMTANEDAVALDVRGGRVALTSVQVDGTLYHELPERRDLIAGDRLTIPLNVS